MAANRAQPRTRAQAGISPVSPVASALETTEEPCDEYAEASVLGYLLACPDSFSTLAPLLTQGADTFYGIETRRVYRALQAMYAKGLPFDKRSIARWILGASAQSAEVDDLYGQLEAIDGCAYPPVDGHTFAINGARMLSELATRRAIRDILRDLTTTVTTERADSLPKTIAAYADGLLRLAQGADGARVTSPFKPLRLSDLLGQLVTPMLDAEMGLREQQLGVLFSEPNVGKSAYIIWRLCVLAQAGRNVVYIAGEGQSGIGARLQAAILTHGFDPEQIQTHLRVIGQAPQLLSAGDVSLLAAQLDDAFDDGEPIALIVLDTLSTAIEGQNENDNSVMNAAAGGLRALMKPHGAAGMILHHPGKDTTKTGLNRIRGGSSMPGTIDLAIELTRPSEESMTLVARCPKARFDAKGWERTYTLHVQPIEDANEPDLSAVTVLAGGALPERKPKTSTTVRDKRMLAMLDVLRMLDCGMLRGAWVKEGMARLAISRASAERYIGQLSAAHLCWRDDAAMFHPSNQHAEGDEDED